MTRTTLSLSFFSLFFLIFSPIISAQKQQEDWLSIYGQLPEFRAFSISPDGQHIAYIQRAEENDMLIVREREQQTLVFAGSIAEFKGRSTFFLNNTHIVLRGSKTDSHFNYKGRYENSGAVIINLKSKRMSLALKGTKNLHPAQGGLGRVVGYNAKQKVLYMPAWDISGAYNLYKVNINTGKGRLYKRGTDSTIDWFVNSKGKVIAREQYFERQKRHIVEALENKKWKRIYEKETALFEISVKGVSKDNQSLLFIDDTENNEALYSMQLSNGEMTGPLFSKIDKDIDGLIMDINRRLSAVKYSGFKPSYDFVDDELGSIYSSIAALFPGSSVDLIDNTEDKKRFIIMVSGNEAPSSYYIFNKASNQLVRLASQYKVDQVADIKAIFYKSRDGLEIPAILTTPPATEAKNLPLIVMPHGGPESYDGIGFDWFAQYLARKGYLVLQPNFRGSTGFGSAFQLAGRGRWGKEMQDDVSDGIQTLINTGHADPARVCIVGASYGGYSALAGAAFTPELYRCVIAINAVSHLPEMLRDEKYKYGRRHWVVNYWHEIIGDSNKEREKLKQISPALFAEQFTAPVLLIHSKDDTVVPIKQSRLMHKKLKKAEKKSELVFLKGEDHWFSTSEMRKQMLKEVDEFLTLHNPVDHP